MKNEAPSPPAGEGWGEGELQEVRVAEYTLEELARAVGGTVQGPEDVVITGAASVSDAIPGDIVLADGPKYLAAAERSAASAVVASDGACSAKPVLRTSDPRRAFAEILRILASEEKHPEPGVDPSAHIGKGVTLGEGAAIGWGCWIGDDVTIGEGAVLHPFVYVGDGVSIGGDCVLHPSVVVYPGCSVGSRVIIHAGAVIGSDGFGYIPVGSELMKVPHIGTVVVEDDVEIGANTTIDRAKTGVTRIGRGTKIDNLVHVAHNVKTGECCILVAQVGIAGSVEIGNGVTVAGQAGMKDHIKVGDGAVIAARAGVIGDVDPGVVYSGFPARPHREQMRAQAALLKLPETLKVVEELRKEVERLKERLALMGGVELGAESE